jgi:urocanate hydratase
VARIPANLIVYGGSGKAARDWKSFQLIVATLRRLEADETLLVQSGKPVGVFKTHALAPRVLIANSNLVGHWATWEHFRELEAENKIMYGQMTAGSWIYIGTQGILQGTYETFAAAATKRFGGTLKRRLVVSGGLGGMGGAQPLAATMNEGTCLVAEVDRRRIEKRLETRYLDVLIEDVDRAIDQALEWKQAGVAKSIGVLCNAVDLLERMIARQVTPDVLDRPDQRARSARRLRAEPHALAAALELRCARPAEVSARVLAHDDRSLQGRCSSCRSAGPTPSTTATTCAGTRPRPASRRPSASRASCPSTSGPLFCEGKGPFRWVALSGDARDIAVTDRLLLELFPQDRALARWIRMAGERVQFQGLPARICWLGYGERQRAGLAFNDAVQRGEISAPIVIGRDHLDCGSVASPNRETEAMKDGTDAVADWPLLNCMLNVASGAAWVSFHHGGGVGMGYSLHAGQVTVADGTPAAAAALERVLLNDPGTGVMRHADAGYDEALRCARERGLDLPGLTS